MGFPRTYSEIRQMVRRKALQTRYARAIMRKSGFRSVTPRASASGARGTPILSLSPCVAAAGCPKPPYPDAIAGLSVDQRQDFYADVAAGEDGDAGALDDLRDWLIQFGYEDQIVMDGVMPLLGYDYDGESYYTFTIESETCPIEFDIVPPQAGDYPDLELGFWEQYKTGDTRFDDFETFMYDYQNCKVLAKRVEFRTEEMYGRSLPHSEPVVNGLDAWTILNREASVIEDLGDPYPTCTYPPGPDPPFSYPSHYSIAQVSIGGAYNVQAWIVNYHADGSIGGVPADATPSPDPQHEHSTLGTRPHIPILCLHTDYLLDNQTATYNYNRTSAVTWYDAIARGLLGGNLFPNPTFEFGYGFENHIGSFDDTSHFPFRQRWQLCHDDLPDWETTATIFPTFRANIAHTGDSTPLGLELDEITWRQYYLTKEGYEYSATVDLTEEPPNVESEEVSMLRYEQDFITFNVIAVRMPEGGPPLEAGTYLYPPV